MLREELQRAQRALGETYSLVAEGRDMGTKVFPSARHKFFLDARPEVRARRRYLEQVQKGLAVTFDDDNYIVVVVKEEWYEDFVQALLKVNPAIEYEIKSLENDKKDGLK